jgi:hypothetical protein
VVQLSGAETVHLPIVRIENQAALAASLPNSVSYSGKIILATTTNLNRVAWNSRAVDPLTWRRRASLPPTDARLLRVDPARAELFLFKLRQRASNTGLIIAQQTDLE